MTEPKTGEQTDDPGEPGGGQYDSPNQEAIGSGHPSQEGTGGEPGETPDPDPEPEPDPDPDPEPEADPLDEMTKDELVEEAGRRGVDVKADWTKADIRKAIDTS